MKNKPSRIINLLAILLSTTLNLSSQSIDSTSANSYQENWIWGQVIFKTSDTLECYISYTPMKTGFILKVKEGDEEQRYNPRYINSFSYYDRISNIDRNFISFPFDKNNISFMEVLFQDSTFLILQAETIYLKVENNVNIMQVPGGMSYADNYQTASVKENNEKYIHNLKLSETVLLTKRNLLRFMVDKETGIKHFIKEFNLKMKEVEDFIKVIHKYNLLKT